MIFLPSRKEVHYFSLHYNKGLKWYEEFFSLANASQIRGEITPYYLFHPYAAERIAHDLGIIRIIILLRDPFHRTLSHYFHACRHGFEELSLTQALKSESSRLTGADVALKPPGGRHQYHQECSYLSRSLYRDQVESYWNYFGRSNVLTLPSELLFSSPWEYLQKIFNFIGLPACEKPDPKALALQKNKGNNLSYQIHPDNADLIRQNLEDSYQFARQDLGWDTTVPWRWRA